MLYFEIKLPNHPNYLLRTVNDNLEHLVDTTNVDTDNSNDIETALGVSSNNSRK